MEWRDRIERWRAPIGRFGVPLLLLPAAVLAVLFLRADGYTHVSLPDQLLDGALTVAVLAVLAGVVLVVATRRGRPRFRRAWWVSWIATLFTWIVAAAAAGSPVPRYEGFAYVAAVGAGLAVAVTSWSRPGGAPTPTLPLQRLGLTGLAGAVSLAGLQAWNTYGFAPEQLEPSLSTSAVVVAAPDGRGGTRVSATITTKNESDVAAVVVASQYVIWGVDVSDADWTVQGAFPGGPLASSELGDNGAAERTILGSGIVYRPYQRVPARRPCRSRSPSRPNAPTRRTA